MSKAKKSKRQRRPNVYGGSYASVTDSTDSPTPVLTSSSSAKSRSKNSPDILADQSIVLHRREMVKLGAISGGCALILATASIVFALV